MTSPHHHCFTVYRHRKGMFYLGIGSVCHSESLSDHILYCALYENDKAVRWIRPLDMFFDEDENGPRFKKVASVVRIDKRHMNDVLMYGYSEWGKGMTPSDFCSSYAQSEYHKSGIRWGLQDAHGLVVSAVNMIPFTPRVCGLASVVTHPDHRKQGWANLLLRSILTVYESFYGYSGFVLNSEIGTSFYEKLGFQRSKEQYHLPSVSMIKGELPDEEIQIFRDYF